MNLRKDLGRKCGECNACCKPMPVPEVGKLGSGWCPQCILGKGCSIYPDRPYACKMFACMWLNGIGDASFRPDILGVMMDCRDRKLGNRIVGELHFWEMREGALQQPKIKQMIDSNKEIGFVIVLHRIKTADTYENQMIVLITHFSEEDIRALTS